MNERQLFESALEIADSGARERFLDEACRGDAELRARVEALLKSHATAGSFLDIPAADQMGSETGDRTTNTIVADPVDDQDEDRAPAEVAFRKYLQPATRTGWLGRLGHYEIEAILGRGAFGIVAKAFDEKLHRVVAIKLMSPELASTSPPRKRFLREARTAAAVTHENIVAIHAVEEEPIPYLVMEYIPGQTLQQRLDAQGPLEPTEILRIGRQVAAGLAAAHAANLIHRDIKPANILLTGGPNERAKISDFGLARAVDDATLTSSGLIAGTPMYMAPEQARGEPLDHRADLFSLGSVLYQMASGRPPFRAANTVAVLKRVCEDTPRPLDDVIPGIPGWLETIVFRLLEKDRDDRYQTAQEVADLLARCQSELQHQGRVTCVTGRRSAAAETQEWPVRTAELAAKGRRPIGWLAVGFVAVVVVTGLLLVQGRRQNAEGNRVRPPAPIAAAATPQAPAETPAVVGWHGWPADAPQPAIAPFDATQALKHQEEWAAYLKVPVEYTNSIGMKFRLIPPGEFMMGSTPEEIGLPLKDVGESKYWQEWIKSEVPQHKVILTQPFYLGVNEVTQAEYAKVTGLRPSHFGPMGKGKAAVAGLETAEHPVEMVSWNDAADFCVKLSQQEKLKALYFPAGEVITLLDGIGYRLPREAEWEFACRAGTVTKYWIGDTEEDLGRAGWFAGNSGGRTHTACELPANPFGLFDVHGNVWEWVQDGWDATYNRRFQEQPAVNPIAPFTVGSLRMLRGGDCLPFASLCRSSIRHATYPADHHVNIGFRVALPVDAARRALKVAQPLTTKPVLTTPSDSASEPVDYAAERRAAEWVLQVQGNLNLVDSAGNPLPLLENKLPPQPFAISAVALNGPQTRDDDLRKLAACRRLGHVSIFADWLQGPGLAHLAPIPSLRTLQIGSGSFTADGLSALTSLTQLRSLTLAGDRVTDHALQYVNQLTRLESLDLPHAPNISDDGLMQLKGLPELYRLSIRSSDGVTDRGLAGFLAAHPSLQILDLPNIKPGEPRSLRVLRGMEKLRDIGVSADQLTDEGIAELKTLPSFKRLFLMHDMTDEVASQVSKLSQLEHLAFLSEGGQQKLTPAGWSKLASLPQWTHLRFFYNSLDNFDDACLQSLTAAPKLTSIELPPAKLTAAGIEAFRKARPDVHLKIGDKDYPPVSVK